MCFSWVYKFTLQRIIPDGYQCTEQRIKHVLTKEHSILYKQEVTTVILIQFVVLANIITSLVLHKPDSVDLTCI